MPTETDLRVLRAPVPKLEMAAFGAAIAAKLAILFAFAWHARFVMDEFVFLGNAKYLAHDFFHTIWPAKTVGYAVFFDLAHRIGWDAVSILRIGRFQTALLGCATVALVYACARAMGESRPRALSIILILLCFSNFIERIFRTIAEPVAVFFAVAALLVVIRKSALSWRELIGAGVLSGLSFLCTQKAVYFNVALGIGLVADAAMARSLAGSLRRGGWLVLGWLLAICAYCLAFGGADALAVAHGIVFGPVEVATHGGDVYPDLRRFVLQTLTRNAILYLACFSGMILSLAQIRALSGQRRIALVFSLVITVLVFLHNQPWPYVFIMALPFVALWALVPLDRLASSPRALKIAVAGLALAVALSFARNAQFWRIDNARQLQTVARAEALLAPREAYFDGIAMLPNRAEPSDLWLDKRAVLLTLAQRERSQAYRNLAGAAPKVIIWSYRMDEIYPVVAPLIEHSYVTAAPNIRLAGSPLVRGQRVLFKVPWPGRYRLYDRTGSAVPGFVTVGGLTSAGHVELARGLATLTLAGGPYEAFLLPEGDYRGRLWPGPDDFDLFADVYN
ncbi:MAG: hypothetical protein ABIT09_11290 [Croceibacterium sp.]